MRETWVPTSMTWHHMSSQAQLQQFGSLGNRERSSSPRLTVVRVALAGTSIDHPWFCHSGDDQGEIALQTSTLASKAFTAMGLTGSGLTLLSDAQRQRLFELVQRTTR